MDRAPAGSDDRDRPRRAVRPRIPAFGAEPVRGDGTAPNRSATMAARSRAAARGRRPKVTAADLAAGGQVRSAGISTTGWAWPCRCWRMTSRSMRRLDRPWDRATTAEAARSCSCPPAAASQSSVRSPGRARPGLDQRRRRCQRCPERSGAGWVTPAPQSTTTTRWSLPSRVSTMCTRSPAAAPSTDGSSSAATTASRATCSSHGPNSVRRAGGRPDRVFATPLGPRRLRPSSRSRAFRGSPFRGAATRPRPGAREW